MKKDGELKKVSDTVKPHLNEENKRERVRFALSMIVPGTNNFDPIFDVVHVNEKWFYLTKVKKSLYVVPGEAVPTRSLKSKRFMDKVMFLLLQLPGQDMTSTGKQFLMVKSGFGHALEKSQQ